MEEKSRYIPASGYHWLTPLYDVVARYFARECTFKQGIPGQVHGADRVNPYT